MRPTRGSSNFDVQNKNIQYFRKGRSIIEHTTYKPKSAHEISVEINPNQYGLQENSNII
ncbi:hypothetical protein [Nitrosopumilus sp.]|uniref:hypothetical protein n=1 Tax=Nitrosopumilus sp. TaxID=2024843 RepID=UPI0034A33DF5